jgi:hypothetical protein
MPMLHGCGYPGCTTFTLSTYCVEHELFVRALKESERTHAHDASPDEQAFETLAVAVHETDASESPALS